MLINLQEGSADMVMASFAVIPVREPYTRWLPPLSKVNRKTDS